MSDSIHAITMPKLGLSMTEGSVAAWHVEPGGDVARGELLADIETSKITNDLEANVSGVLRKIVVELGVEVPVGALIAVVADADVPDEDIERFVADYSAAEPAIVDVDDATAAAADEAPPAAAASGGEQPHTAATLPGALAGDYDADAVFATHHAHKLAQRLGINLAAVEGSGRKGRISKRDVVAALEAAGVSASAAPGSAAAAGADDAPRNIKTTPIAKRLAAQHGIDLSEITATGTRGRITKGDVLRHIEAAETAAQTDATGNSGASNPYDEESLSSARKVIARRLSASKSQAPHFRVSVDVVIDKLLELKRDIEQEETGVKVSINDMLVRAVGLALVRHPGINIQFDGENVRKYRHADVAVAVALDDGLVTPVVRGADRKGLIEIAREIADLAERARAGRLTPDEIEGGTFTISNLGMFGVKSFDAIINPPQAAIMAIGRAEKRLYVGDEDSGRVATFMTVTMACDHRVIDGAAGGRFLQTFKDMLQHPGRLLL